MELYDAKRLVKIITEGPDTSYFTIDNLYIENSKNTEVPPEGEEVMHITPEATLHKNINELQAQSYKFDDDKYIVTGNIPDSVTH